jgi:hypothetical protein
MIKRKFDSETYIKMGKPDIGSTVYFMKSGEKVWGKISLISFYGFKGAKDGLILLGLTPFKK